MHEQPKDTINTAPTFVGTHGRLWEVDVAAIRRDDPQRAAGSVTAWIIEAVWAHPWWHSYCLSLIHLRDVDGMPPAKFAFPGATHDLYLHALDPDGEREPLIKGSKFAEGKACRVLTPTNFVAQFIADDDEHAKTILFATALEIVAGRLNPDTDYRHQWIAKFGNNGMLPEYQGADEPRFFDFRGRQ